MKYIEKPHHYSGNSELWYSFSILLLIRILLECMMILFICHCLHDGGLYHLTLTDTFYCLTTMIILIRKYSKSHWWAVLTICDILYMHCFRGCWWLLNACSEAILLIYLLMGWWERKCLPFCSSLHYDTSHCLDGILYFVNKWPVLWAGTKWWPLRPDIRILCGLTTNILLRIVDIWADSREYISVTDTIEISVLHSW